MTTHDTSQRLSLRLTSLWASRMAVQTPGCESRGHTDAAVGWVFLSVRAEQPWRRGENGYPASRGIKRLAKPAKRSTRPLEWDGYVFDDGKKNT